MDLQKKSIKINVVLNIIRVIGTILIPLCVTPYIARVLGVTNMGKINFGNAVVEYFSLLASLGIYSYAVKEGTARRNSRHEIDQFASEIFRLNLFTTIIAFAIFLLCIRYIPQFFQYRLIILMQAANIVFTTLGAEWVYGIYEDYIYITVRTLVIQACAMVGVFAGVKNPKDIYLYLLINMLSGFSLSLSNHIRSKKYCRINPLGAKINMRQIKPIMYIFFSTVASTIYTNIDITMIGVIRGDYPVGIYSMAVKICGVFKQIIFAGIDVTMPRLSYMAKNNINAYYRFLSRIVYIVLLVVVPLISGAIIQRKNIIWLLLGDAYSSAELSLAILFIAVLFATAAYLVMHTMLLPLGEEKILLSATLFGSGVNLVLNSIMIPTTGITGAAIATVLSEGSVFFVSFWRIRNKVYVQITPKWIMVISISNTVMIGWMLIIKIVVRQRIYRLKNGRVRICIHTVKGAC